ncbi:hypothetical protein PACTADRAFT_82567, partial [Pachysolen tannophilus NRRL Y-2460]
DPKVDSKNDPKVDSKADPKADSKNDPKVDSKKESFDKDVKHDSYKGKDKEYKKDDKQSKGKGSKGDEKLKTNAPYKKIDQSEKKKGDEKLSESVSGENEKSKPVEFDKKLAEQKGYYVKTNNEKVDGKPEYSIAEGKKPKGFKYH